MQINKLVIFFIAVYLTQSIGLYDFNSCRISNCNA